MALYKVVSLLCDLIEISNFNNKYEKTFSLQPIYYVVSFARHINFWNTFFALHIATLETKVPSNFLTSFHIIIMSFVPEKGGNKQNVNITTH